MEVSLTSVEALQLVFSLMGARDLAMACCCCKLWNEVGCNEHLWRSLCLRKWPGCDRREVGKKAIQGMGGYKIFYSKRAAEEEEGQAVMMGGRRRRRRDGRKKWMGVELRMKHAPAIYSTKTSWEELTFFVDLQYKDNVVLSVAISGGGGRGAECSRYWSVGDDIDPMAAQTEPVLPRHVLTPCFYRGVLFYEAPFQASHVTDYSLRWCVARNSDGRIMCLLTALPDVWWNMSPWEHERVHARSPPHASASTLPLLFHSDLVFGHHQYSANAAPDLVSFACLHCQPIWGASLSHPMRLQFIDLHLGLWKRSGMDEGDDATANAGGTQPSSCDSLLLLVQQLLDWH